MISILFSFALVGSTFAFPSLRLTGEEVEPVFVADYRNDTSGWHFNALLYSDAAEIARSDDCHYGRCPDALANLTGTDLYFFSEGDTLEQYVYYEPTSLKDIVSAVVYTRFYTGMNGQVGLFNFYPWGSDTDLCYAEEQSNYTDDEGFPQVCWYETVRYTKTDGESDFRFGFDLTYSDTFAVLDTFQVALYDVDVGGTNDCLAYPVVGTCVEGPVLYATTTEEPRSPSTMQSTTEEAVDTTTSRPDITTQTTTKPTTKWPIHTTPVPPSHGGNVNLQINIDNVDENVDVDIGIHVDNTGNGDENVDVKLTIDIDD